VVLKACLIVSAHRIFLVFLSNNEFLQTQTGYSNNSVMIFFIATIISHSFSFLYNYIWKKEYHDRSVIEQMMMPYQRVMVLQLTIIFGGFLSIFLPDYIIIVFVIVKIYLDIKTHISSHKGVFTDNINEGTGLNFLSQGDKVDV
jgi:hypothetical protein